MKTGSLNKFIGKKELSSEAPQGESTDEFLKKRNLDFFSFLIDNTRNSEISINNGGLKKFLIGGEEEEPKVLLDNPLNPLQPRKSDYQDIQVDPTNNFYGSPFGIYGTQSVPDYVNSYVQANPYSQDPPIQSQTQTTDNSRRNNNIADLSLAGVQVANNFFSRYQAAKQDENNQKKYGIESTAQMQYGNRGDYDVNSGAFRSDQLTPVSYKKGGEYKISGKTELDRLREQGYEFDILD